MNKERQKTRRGNHFSLTTTMSPPNPVGILNLHKPTGMTSREVVDRVVRAAKTGRVGHAGTLDPLATGVVLVCVGWATRLVPCLHELRKLYRAEFLLGRTSDTDDITGQVEMLAGGTLPDVAAVRDALPQYLGRIRQVPPQHSAVHSQGRRAYQWARQGVAVELVPREVEVFRFDLLLYDFPRLVVEIECGSGTYIRALGRDLGRDLGCGAVMSRLERLAIGAFNVESAVSPAELTAENLWEHLLPPLSAVRHWPQFECPEHLLVNVQQGKALPCPANIALPTRPQVAIVTPAGELAALAEFDPSRQALRPRQVFLYKPGSGQTGSMA